MSNRQARREQARTGRNQRNARSVARPGGQRPRRSGSGTFSRPFLLLVAALVIALGVVLVVVFALAGGGDRETVQQLEEGRTPADIPQAGLTLGSDDAPLKMAMYEDFQCPICLNFTAEDKPGIVEEYVRAGKLQLEFKFFPVLGLESTAASIAGFCLAEQDRFWAFHDELFLIQGRAGQNAPGGEERDIGRFSDSALRGVAEDVGADVAAYDSCVTSQAALNAVEDDEAEVRSLGFSGTPSFSVNGQPLTTGDPGNMDNWRTVLDALYEAVTASPTPGPGTPTATASADTTPTPTNAP